jgi:hypothetical protein
MSTVTLSGCGYESLRTSSGSNGLCGGLCYGTVGGRQSVFEQGSSALAELVVLQEGALHLHEIERALRAEKRVVERVHIE